MIADEIGRVMPLLEAFVRDGALLFKGKSEIADLDIHYIVAHPEYFSPLLPMKWGFRVTWCGLQYEVRGFSSKEAMEQSDVWQHYCRVMCVDQLDNVFSYRD